jgi:hypothetical protein
MQNAEVRIIVEVRGQIAEVKAPDSSSVAGRNAFTSAI